MNYTLASLSDIKEIMEVIEDGRALLKIQGNGQWQNGYPNQNDIENDIKNKNLYVLKDRETNSQIVACSAFTHYESGYDTLYEGAWKSNYNYLVMHRIACKKEYRNKGYGKDLFSLFEIIAKNENIHSLRVDTHEFNDIMISLLNKCGFIYCGRVLLPGNKDRVVYEKLI